MKSPAVVTLPVAAEQYDGNDEQVMRRTVEQGFQDLRSDVVDNRSKTDKDSSLALRRFQFLLMGA